MTHHPHPHRSARRQACRTEHGMSLVELLVAIAIGLTLVTGLATLFANSSQSGTDLERSIRQMENGRYAIDLMTEDISVAGYYGELSAVGLSYSTPGACAAALADLGWDNPGAAVPIYVSGLSATQAAALTCLAGYKAGTQALILRRLDTVAVAPAAVASGAYVQTSRCNTDPNATRFIVSSTASDFTLRELDCTALTNVRRYISRIYYVAACNECGLDSMPTLKRAEIGAGGITVSPLAEGIEDVAFEFGFDTNDDGTPDLYRSGLSGTAGAADNDWGNAMSVRVYLLSRATDTTPGFADDKTYSLGLAGTRGPFTDSYKRRAHTVTVRMHNPSGSRETP